MNTASGTLAPIAGSPFNERFDPHAIAIHPSGRFLFVLNQIANDVSAFNLDPGTGALSEVVGSPFAVGDSTNPVFIAVEPSGRFLYVVNNANTLADTIPPSGSIDCYSIDQTTGALTPTMQPSVSLPVFPAALLVSPGGGVLYVVGTNSLIDLDVQIVTFEIDSATGNLSNGPTLSGIGQDAWSGTIDPDGRFLVVGRGQAEGMVDVFGLVPGFGNSTLTADSARDLPVAMAIDSTGTYLYVLFTNDGIREFSISGGTLTELPGSPIRESSANVSTLVADPTAPLVYSAPVDANLLEAFQISPSGALIELPSVTLPGGTSSVAMVTGIATAGASVPGEPISAPVAAFLPESLPFGNQSLGTTSAPQLITLSNTGSAELIINANGISLTGANSADFSIQTDNCPAVLLPSASCSLTITYHPSVTGSEQALLRVSDNATGSPQSAPLIGTGFVPSPAVTLTPGSLSFPDTDQGSSSASKLITVTNAGTATLHVASNGVVLAGPNSGDFAQTNNCSGSAMAGGGSCMITVVFQPTALGTRTAEVQIADDAEGGLQTVSLSGNGVVPFTISLDGSAESTQSVAAGATAQYNLQLVPAGGFKGMILLSCTGAPQGATCTVPSNVQVNGAAAVDFVVTVTTTVRSEVLNPRGPLLAPWTLRGTAARGLWLLIICLFLAFTLHGYRDARQTPWPDAIGHVAGVLLICTLLTLVACGGGATGSAPASVTAGTPSGTSTLSVVATAGGVVQTFNVTLTVQ